MEQNLLNKLTRKNQILFQIAEIAREYADLQILDSSNPNETLGLPAETRGRMAILHTTLCGLVEELKAIDCNMDKQYMNIVAKLKRNLLNVSTKEYQASHKQTKGLNTTV